MPYVQTGEWRREWRRMPDGEAETWLGMCKRLRERLEREGRLYVPGTDELIAEARMKAENMRSTYVDWMGV